MLKKYRLWLDDVRPIPEWMENSNCIWYDTAEAMIANMDRLNRLFSLDEIEFISLDNDLGEGRIEGYEVLDWLESLQIPINFGIHIHTSNPVARERMRAIIRRNGWKEIL